MSDRLFRISNPKQNCLEFEIQNKTNIMGIKNKTTSNELYFLTFTVVDWVDVFTKPKYKHIIVDALQFAVDNKGLDLFAWCIMTNHIHLIARSKKKFELSDIIRDFKKFTNKAIIKLIQEVCSVIKSINNWASDFYEELRVNYLQLHDELTLLIPDEKTEKSNIRKKQFLEEGLKEW